MSDAIAASTFGGTVGLLAVLAIDTLYTFLTAALGAAL